MTESHQVERRTERQVKVGLLKPLPSGYKGEGTNPIFRAKDGSLWQGFGESYAIKVVPKGGSWVVAENGLRKFDSNEEVTLISGWQTDL